MRATFDGAGAQLAAELYGLCYTIEPRGIKRGDDVRDTSRDATCERRGVYVCYMSLSADRARVPRAARARSTVSRVQPGGVIFSLSHLFPLPEHVSEA